MLDTFGVASPECQIRAVGACTRYVRFLPQKEIFDAEILDENSCSSSRNHSRLGEAVVTYRGTRSFNDVLRDLCQRGEIGSRNCVRQGKASSTGEAVVTYCEPSSRSFNAGGRDLCTKIRAACRSKPEFHHQRKGSDRLRNRMRWRRGIRRDLRGLRGYPNGLRESWNR